MDCEAFNSELRNYLLSGLFLEPLDPGLQKGAEARGEKYSGPCFQQVSLLDLLPSGVTL